MCLGDVLVVAGQSQEGDADRRRQERSCAVPRHQDCGGSGPGRVEEAGKHHAEVELRHTGQAGHGGNGGGAVADVLGVVEVGGHRPEHQPENRSGCGGGQERKGALDETITLRLRHRRYRGYGNHRTLAALRAYATGPVAMPMTW